MKKSVFTVVVVAAMAMMASCVKEPAGNNDTPFKKGDPVTVTFRTGSGAPETRTGNPDAGDTIRSSLRVLIYETQAPNAGKLRWNFFVNPYQEPCTLNIETGTFDFVFIVNEAETYKSTAPSTLINLDNIAVGDPITDLETLMIGSAAFAVNRPIPMIGKITNVDVINNHHVEYNDNGTPVTFQNAIWEVPVTRAGVRLSIDVKLTDTQYNEWLSAHNETGGNPTISFRNIPAGAHLMQPTPPTKTNAETPTGNWSIYSFGEMDIIQPNTGTNTTDKYILHFPRVILPEFLFTPLSTPEANEAKAVALGMWFNNGESTIFKSAVVKYEDPPKYQMPRNHWLHLTVSAKDADLEIETDVLPWNEFYSKRTISGKYYLSVSRSTVNIPYTAGNHTINVTTNYPTWSIDRTNPTTATWLTTITPATGTANHLTGGTTVTFTVEENPSNTTPRQTTFTVVAGDMIKIITVVQAPAPFRLYYSEGNATYGSNTAFVPLYTNQPGTATTATSFTINLTSPVGAETGRYFSTYGMTFNSTVNQAATISQINTGSSADATVSTASTSWRRLAIPIGYEGIITLVIGDAFTITLNVTADDGIDTPASAKAKAAAAKVGETFKASGIEWRVIHKTTDEALIMAEHVLDMQQMHNIATSWDTNINWMNSNLRRDLNNATYTYSYENLSFKTVIKHTPLITRQGWNSDLSGYNGATSATNDYIFLLSEEECSGVRAISNNNPADRSKNVYPGVALFADGLARRVTRLEGLTSGAIQYWGRSSSELTTSVVSFFDGSTVATNATTVRGVRPACIIYLVEPPAPFRLYYSEGNLMMGSESRPTNYNMSNLTTDKNLTINLTTPVGAATARYFTALTQAATAVASNQTATIAHAPASGVTGIPTFTTASGSLKTLLIPQNYAGVITLTIGGVYTITVNVTPGVAPSNSVKIGETFAADGIEWRVLAKEGTKTLVITEHIIANEPWQASGNYVGWRNNSEYAATPTNIKRNVITPLESTLTTFGPKILTTTLITRRYAYEHASYNSAPNTWWEITAQGVNTERYNTSTDNKLFLLSMEEVGYGSKSINEIARPQLGNRESINSFITTDDPGMRTSGSHVLFGDNWARVTNRLGDAAAQPPVAAYCWLFRSPGDTFLAMVYGINVTISNNGIFISVLATNTHGVRPACWANLGN